MDLFCEMLPSSSGGSRCTGGDFLINGFKKKLCQKRKNHFFLSICFYVIQEYFVYYRKSVIQICVVLGFFK